MAKDYYEILGIKKSASADEVKSSFRKLARQYHPDSHPDISGNEKKAMEEKFKDVSEAYEVLSDPQKRSMYDNTGRVEFGPGRQDFNWQDFTHFSDFEDIFNRIFGGGGGGFSSDFFSGFGGNQGPDLDMAIRVTVSLDDAYYGKTREIRFRRNRTCEKCKGSGAEDGKLLTCKTCNGTGQQRIVQGQGFFKMVSVTMCKDCGGAGRIPKKACTNCKGNGTLSVHENLKVKIPKGAPNNLKIRYRGRGQSFKTRTGDLFVLLNIPDETGISRNEDDLYLEREITFPEAALGTDIDIKLFNEKFTLHVPPGTQPGERLKMKGAGMPHMNRNGSGDLMVRMMIEVPKKLTSRQKELISLLQEESPKKKGWFGKSQ